ncbi:ParB/RepB/Spo0J family partition protein [Frigidibacter sp. ROC022]|uniref:ParB/RepB/Spo0J family partition protein n=1 Tax=Frigidibacter sp. ROC022 TaxID=2971796 RepID=UPI00215A9F63|nr:ParB N-terminal domain-containing protein [Frigidibacter sp. ROC022]MCR8724249.1 ParB N-terminal domain-containing protein [Frigidibacter sp. ROC022]
MDIRLIPLDAIDADSLPRDRSVTDESGLEELCASIRANGLRSPIELHLLHDRSGPGFGLVSGHRRLAAFRRLHAARPEDASFQTIPAVVRHASRDQLLRMMVEENDIRAAISPWDQARIAVTSVPDDFPTVDAAVAALYPAASRQRRARIRAVAVVVEELYDVLLTPERLSMRQLERLAAACRGGFTDLIEGALRQSRASSSAAQWAVLENVLREAEAEARAAAPSDPRPGRPRRQVRLKSGLVMRREMTRNGWCLHFTGKQATGELLEEVMDWVEGKG